MWIVLCEMPVLSITVYTEEQVRAAVKAFADIYGYPKIHGASSFSGLPKTGEQLYFTMFHPSPDDTPVTDAINIKATYLGDTPQPTPRTFKVVEEDRYTGPYGANPVSRW